MDLLQIRSGKRNDGRRQYLRNPCSPYISFLPPCIRSDLCSLKFKLNNNNHLSLPTKEYSVRGVSCAALASHPPGVVVVVDASALLAAVLEPVQQLLLVARGIAPTPLALQQERLNNFCLCILGKTHRHHETCRINFSGTPPLQSVFPGEKKIIPSRISLRYFPHLPAQRMCVIFLPHLLPKSTDWPSTFHLKGGIIYLFLQAQ